VVYRAGDGPVGCLLIHGWSGHPGEVRLMADYLARRGVAVVVPTLPGHGGAPEEMARSSFRQWIAAVTCAWTDLRRTHPLSFVGGLSMGGALALDLAARRPTEVRGVVTMAALTSLPYAWPGWVVPWGRHLVKWYSPLAGADLADPAVQERIRRRTSAAGIDFADPAVQERIRAASRVSVASVYQLQLLLRDVRRHLPDVSAPLLIMHGRRDDVVAPRQAETIYARAASADKRLVWLDGSHHMLPTDVDRQQVWEAAWEFIRARAAPGAAPGLAAAPPAPR
jgi:carboxylesterase